jgi:DNA-binding transcriptional LysR family regulator
MSMDNLRSLVEVARRGAITDAARALGLTQPALSRRIQLLEAEFGAPLFARSQKGVQLTELGRLVEAEGRRLVDRYDHLKRDVGSHLRLERGTARIGAGATAVSFLLPPLIRDFRLEHPDVVFHVKEAGSREIAADVADGCLELGIVTLPAASQELEVIPLRRDSIVLVGAIGHPLARSKRVSAAALNGMPLIGFEGDTAIRRLIDRALEEAGVQVEVVMELRSVQSILRMVALELGLAFVSELGVERTGKDVRVIDVIGLKIRRSLAVIHSRTRPLSIAAAAFLERIKADSAA